MEDSGASAQAIFIQADVFARVGFPAGCVKTTPQKTRFRSVNLYKEFAYKSEIDCTSTN